MYAAYDDPRRFPYSSHPPDTAPELRKRLMEDFRFDEERARGLANFAEDQSQELTAACAWAWSGRWEPKWRRGRASHKDIHSLLDQLQTLGHTRDIDPTEVEENVVDYIIFCRENTQF